MVSENAQLSLSMMSSSVSPGKKNDRAATVHVVGVAANLYLLSRLGDVLRGGQGGVYRPEPFPPRNRWNVKIEGLPVHIEHDVEVGITVKAAHREGQDRGIGIVPARAVQTAPVPGDVGQPTLVLLARKEAAALQERMALAQDNHLLEEVEHLPVLLRKIPVEPADLVILAVGV